jgi:hypothetical protein
MLIISQVFLFKKIKEGLWDHLAVCLCIRLCLSICLGISLIFYIFEAYEITSLSVVLSKCHPPPIFW